MPFDRFRKASAKAAAAAPVQAAGPAQGVDTAAAIRALAHDAASMGREAAELLGVVDDLAAIGRRQAEALAQAAGEVGQMLASNQSISSSIGDSVRSAQIARSAVERVASDVTAAATSLQQVADAAADITKIALQTRLVAFNASVEAKRAGAAGRGFSVVAEAVKDLAQKVEQSSKQIAGTVQALDSRIQELARNIRQTSSVNGQDSFNLAFGRVEEAVARIAAAAEQNVQGCASTERSMQGMAGQAREQAAALDQARGRAAGFLTSSEKLIELSADCGAETEDTPFIRQVQQTAAAVSACFERALAAGEIGLADLFDEQYVKIEGTDPQQLRTRFTDFADRVLPAFQEPMLQFSDKVVFCAAVDRNGYLPTHNLKFSRPQGADPVWNAANSRNRRIFADRTGLAAGRNARRFLLQTYRRDMGGGRFVLMKDLSAPIRVQGRHWGGLRLAYQF